ncbi:MAG: LytTR family DNA-binding domain-containing protein [Saprospiraceae bacterium]
MDNTFFFVRQQEFLKRVNIHEIKYVIADGNICTLHLIDERTVQLKASLRQLLSKLPLGKFLRIHKSCIVNLDYLEKVEVKTREAHLGDTKLPIGKTYYPDILELLHLI